MKQEAYPEKAPKTAFRIINDEAVILNLDNGIYYSLNEVGARIWELCNGSTSIKDIILSLCQEFEVDEIMAEVDVAELISDLLSENLIILNEHPK